MLAFAWIPAVLTLSTAAPTRTTWYVDAVNCEAGADGSRENPFCTIQEAVDVATSGDLVLVAAGDYVENLVVPAMVLRIIATDLVDQTILRGSDQGTQGSEPTVRVSPGARLRLAGFTVTDGMPGILCEGAGLQVLNCVLTDNQGFEVGFARVGAGIYASDSALAVTNTVIEGNSADQGGGIGLSHSSLVAVDATFGPDNFGIEGAGLHATEGCALSFLRCVFDGNDLLGDGYGAALYASQSTLLIEESEFVKHSYDQGLGTLYLSSSDATLRDCRFDDNDGGSMSNGGALYVQGTTDDVVTVEDCTFTSNTSAEGGAIEIVEGTVTLSGCRFEENLAFSDTFPRSGNGGAAFVHPTAAVLFRRCVFLANEAAGTPAGGGFGGAVHGPATLESCTLFRNRSTGTGAGGGGAAQATILDSCILWENEPEALMAVGEVSWSDVQGGWTGTGNFDAPPRLWGPEHGDLHLLPDSPCIDTGNPDRQDEDGSRLDVGAYAYSSAYCGSPGTYCVAKTSPEGCLPAIGWSGTPTLAGDDDFFLRVTDLPPDRSGLFVWTLDGAAASPFRGGTLCLTPTVFVTPLVASTGQPPCDGVLDFHWSQAFMQDAGLGAGTRFHVQFWYRDPLDATGTGLSDGLEAVVCAGA